ncbi:hypothetical protein [Chryseobacterium sp. MDT2-18]|uniref:hypothetical protein n=1 Tax=Chryseobacterium sp. MDT2-18 TaxID=1259136 RepID=UPI00277E5B6D|nr:hypothetical protein [Chryseobacterium sp. MDT2-18]MDQ0476067.1 hypothetical protein [Chryseobacterium sp. MDT2-18]
MVHNGAEIAIYTSIIALFAILIYAIFDYEKLNSDIIGVLIFDEEYIQIKSTKLEYPEIQSLEIFTNYFKGQLRITFSNKYFGPWNYVGKNNFAKITTFDQRVFNLEFQIMSQQDLKSVNELYAKLLLSGKIKLYSHSLHKVPQPIKQTPSFLLYVIKLVDEKTIGKEYSERILNDRY